MTSQSVIPSYRSLKDSGLTLTTIFTSLLSEHRSCSKLKEPSPLSLRKSNDPLKSARQSDNQKRAKEIKSIPELRILETQISRLKTNTEEQTMNSKERNSLDTFFNDVEKEDDLCPLIPESKPERRARQKTKSKNSIFIDENRKSQSIKKLNRIANPRKAIPSKPIVLKKLSDGLLAGRPQAFAHLRLSKEKSQSSHPVKGLALSNVSIHKPELSNPTKSFDQRIHFFSHRPANIPDLVKKLNKSRDIRRLDKSAKNASALNVSLKACINNLYKDRTTSKKNGPLTQSKSFKNKRFSLIQFPKVITNISALNKHFEPSENVNKVNIRMAKDKDLKKTSIDKEHYYLGQFNKSSLENRSSVFRVLQRMNAIGKVEPKPNESRPKKIPSRNPSDKQKGMSLKVMSSTPKEIGDGKIGPTFKNYFKVGNHKKAVSKKVNTIEIFDSETGKDSTPKSIPDFIRLSKLNRNDFKELEELKNESSIIFEMSRKNSTNRNSVEKSIHHSKETKVEIIQNDQKMRPAHKGSFKFIPISPDSLTQLPHETSSKQLTNAKPVIRNSSRKNLNNLASGPISTRDIETFDWASMQKPPHMLASFNDDVKTIALELAKDDFMRNYKNSEFTLEMKSTVVDWLFQVAAELQISRQTVYIALHVLQSYLSKTTLNPDCLQFDALTALALAIKFEEVHYFSLEQLIKSMEDAYSVSQLVENERKMFAVLDYDIRNHTNLCLLHAVQYFWDNNASLEILDQLPKNYKPPKFLEKSEESYNLYRISMNQLDYLMMTHEEFNSIEQMIASILISTFHIFYQSAILKDECLGNQLIIVVANFIEQLFRKKYAKDSLVSDGLLERLRHLPNVLDIPSSENYATYHEYLFTQVHNPALLQYIDSIL
jgi:hypothetical protein